MLMNTWRMAVEQPPADRLTREMKEAAKLLEFEHAAFLRDQIDRLRRGENPTVDSSAETERKQNHAQTQRRVEKVPWHDKIVIKGAREHT